jgi:hypothetical protein
LASPRAASAARKISRKFWNDDGRAERAEVNMKRLDLLQSHD